ncbi:MAG: cysteine desulfurase [Patescibacteria group bacterium]
MSKKDFPIFTTYPDLVYLDSASTSQKPQEVIDAVTNFYTTKNANVHRGIYALAEEATTAYEEARQTVADFINAKDASEIIFTGNTNESINQVAYGWARKHLQKGDIIVTTEMEHHANIVPWQRLRDEIGIELVYLPIDGEGKLAYKKISDSSFWQTTLGVRPESKKDAGQASMTAIPSLSKIKLITLTHASNVLGTVNSLEEIIPYFREIAPHAKIVVDAAQSVAHLPIDVQKLDVDFLAFSAHKLFGPTGIGVLWGRKELLTQMEPLHVGSHMIESVKKTGSAWTEIPWRFEVGTGKLEGAVGLAAAIKYIQRIGWEKIIQHEQVLTKYALEQLQKVEGVTLYGPKKTENRLGIFSFGIEGVHPHDIAQILDRSHVAVRSGHHCAQPLMEVLGVSATARASVSIYNDKEDIDALIQGLSEVKKILSL